MEQCVRLEAKQLPEYWRDTQLKTFLLLINKHRLSTDSCEAISICSVLGTKSANGRVLCPLSIILVLHMQWDLIKIMLKQCQLIRQGKK